MRNQHKRSKEKRRQTSKTPFFFPFIRPFLLFFKLILYSLFIQKCQANTTLRKIGRSLARVLDLV